MSCLVLVLGLLLVSHGDAQATCPFASMLTHVGKAIPRLSRDGVEAASVEISEFSATSPQMLTQGPGRTLQQEDAEFSSQDSFADVADDDSVFTLASQVSGAAIMLTSSENTQVTSFTVSNITASIELDDGPTYAASFNASDPASWEAGNSRVNVTARLLYGAATAMPQQVQAQLHRTICTSGSDFNSSTLTDQYSNSTGIISLLLPVNSTSTASVSSIIPYLIDFDQAASVVILTSTGTPVACANLIPPPPDFPTEWSATVETTISNKGYTFVADQYYSSSNNMVRLDLHSNGTDRVLIQDFDNNELTIITGQNATYPHGVCETRSMSSRFSNFSTGNDNNALLSTGEFLRFTGEDQTANFVPGVATVRGIDCEQWSYDIGFGNSTYNVSYFFPINQWQVARESYHRLLQQISLTGVRNGNEINHTYSFVNFRPITEPDALFNPCSLAPLGTNCGCTSSLLKALAAQGSDNPTADALGIVDIDSESDGNLSQLASEAAAAQCPKGFTHRQGGPYALMFIFGMAAGILLTLLTSFLWDRFSSHRPGFGRTGHKRFQDAPAMGSSNATPPFQFATT